MVDALPELAREVFGDARCPTEPGHALFGLRLARPKIPKQPATFQLELDRPAITLGSQQPGAEFGGKELLEEPEVAVKLDCRVE